MAKIWTNGFETFETEDEARENVLEHMEWSDYEESFYDNIDFHDFFTRIRKIVDPEKFFIEFEDEFGEAENEYFDRNYWEEEEENNNEE